MVIPLVIVKLPAVLFTIVTASPAENTSSAPVLILPDAKICLPASEASNV